MLHGIDSRYNLRQVTTNPSSGPRHFLTGLTLLFGVVAVGRNLGSMG